MLDLLIGAWKQHLGAALGSWWDSVAVWRTVGLVLLAAVVAAAKWRRHIAVWLIDRRSYEHDLAIFKKADDAVTESFLADLLNADLYNMRCSYKDIARAGHFCEDFNRIENQYLSRRLRRTMEKFRKNLSEVDYFVGKHFFAINDDRLKLYPERRLDDKEYAAYIKEMHALTLAAWEAYKEYRAAVKRLLKV